MTARHHQLAVWLLAAMAVPPLATLPVRADAPPEAVELPAVPASVDPRGRRSPSPLAAGTVSIAPGETKALVVSAGNVNRIVTPFAQPDIVTTSPDQFTVRQNVVYAAPAAGDPLTLYITEKGDETRAISLILMPQVNVASREFRLVMAGSGTAVPHGAGSVRQAATWEQSQPFEVTLTDLMAGLATGVVPQGYDLAAAADPAAAPRCAAPAPFRIDFDQSQLLTGGQLEAWVGMVANAGGTTAELSETACATTPNVVAVAIWPSPRLQPGAQAEIYVVRRVAAARSRTPAAAEPARGRAWLLILAVARRPGSSAGCSGPGPGLSCSAACGW